MASISILPETTMSSNPNPKDFPFPRKIEFLPARKPFDPYSSTSNGDFHLETLNPGAGYQTPVSLGAAAACSPAKKSDGAGELVELGLDPELDFGITFRRIGAGLANLGNTCFLNSVLQCLTYTEPFAAYLQSGKHKTSCRTAGFCALCAIQNHVKNALQSTGKILSPSHFVKNLRCISRNFRNCRQEDAHELMVNLLESMHKCCLPYGVSSETPAAYEKSLVHKIFGGRLRSQVKCMQCSYCSNKYDPFLDLSLEIVRADSLRKALSHFTAEELLDGGEKHYQCQRCKQKVQARKQLTVHKAPYVLTIHLKRFSSHNPGQKIDKKIEFAPSLDLKPFVSGPYDGDLRYTLYGVLVHAGWSTHSGHYYCYVRTSSGMWYTLDDNRVFQVSEKTVLQQKAYMLFYVLDRRNLAPKVPLNKIRNENMSKIVGEQVRLATTMDSKQVSQHGPTNNTIRTDPITSGNHQAPSVCSTLPADTLVKGVLLKDTISLESVSQVMKDSKNMNGTSVNHCLPKKLLSGQSHSEEHIFKDAVLNDADSSPKMVSGKVQEAQKMDGNDSRVPLVEHSSSLHEKELTAMPLNEADPAEREKNVQEAFCKQSNASDGCENGGNSEINFSSKHEEQIKGSVADQSYKCIEAEGVAGQGAKAEGAFVFETVAETSDSCKEPKLKKDVRYPVTAALCIGSKQLFFSSLGIRRKKKLQRMKRLTSDMKQFKKKSSMEEPCSNEQGTSTSESFEGNEPNRACMKKRKGFREVKEVKQHNEARLDVKQECLVVENGSQISFSTSEQHTEKRKPPIRGQVHSTEPHVCKSGGSVHNVVLSTMPSGLSETTVARWDDIDLPSTDTLNSDVPQMSSSIGYVADAWDEEYDQGKRKKVRKSGIFGGPNPFQEIATQKAESKTMNAKRPSKHWKAASHCRKFQHKKQTRRR